MTVITANLNKTTDNSYDIIVKRGGLFDAGTLLNLNRRVMIVTDTGIPKNYVKSLASLCKDPYIYTVPAGEESKSLLYVEKITSAMLENGFNRSDCLVALGGGVCGDLGGFTASVYMRGIDFYNIPTTLLSQVDSSIGGKTAVNLGAVKNIVGAFYQPKKVIIDPDLLKTLPKRQLSNGMAEAVKMALCFDSSLFSVFETEDLDNDDIIDKIIVGSLNTKKRVVELDEKEQGLRKVLNFGHTIGHGIESVTGMKELYHGECVAIGMLPMCSPEVRSRLTSVLEKLSLPTRIICSPEKIFASAIHDKKAGSKGVCAVFVNKVGEFEIKNISFNQLKDIIYGEYSE